jgi:hypothetical protein
VNQNSLENRAPRETDCGNIGSAEPFGSWRRPMSTSVHWTETTIELPGVREGGMSGRNERRKPGTTRGSPRRSRTAKASRISRHAVKSRCAREWGGWGRLSDDGPGQNNPDPSEGLWGGGLVTHHGGALSSPRPGAVRDNRCDHEVHEGRTQTGCQTAHAGSRLKPLITQEGTAWKASLPAVLGRTRRTLRQEKSRRGGREYDLKPFNVIQRVQLPPGKGEPASRK